MHQTKTHPAQYPVPHRGQLVAYRKEGTMVMKWTFNAGLPSTATNPGPAQREFPLCQRAPLLHVRQLERPASPAAASCFGASRHCFHPPDRSPMGRSNKTSERERGDQAGRKPSKRKRQLLPQSQVSGLGSSESIWIRAQPRELCVAERAHSPTTTANHLGLPWSLLMSRSPPRFFPWPHNGI